MFARRNFVYKRSQNGAHLRLAARDSPTPSSVNEIGKPATSTPVAQTTDPLTQITPIVPQTTIAPATSPSPATPSLSTPTPSSPSSASSADPISSATLISSAAASSSHALTASSIVSTPLTLASTPGTHAASVSTPGVIGASFTPTSSAPPSATSSAHSSGSTSTSAIVGGVAGTLAGIAVLGFLLMWCMRRQRNRDSDDFDAQAFKRQSAILIDDPVEPSRSQNPRPPTMIERHNASPALAAQGGYAGQNFYGSYGGYGQQPPYGPSEIVQPIGSPLPQAYGASPTGYTSYNDPQQQVSRQPPNVGYAGYDSQQQLARQPSNGAYLTHQPSSAGYAPPAPGSLDQNAHYIDLNRSSISPYQAAQYADISRQLSSNDPIGHAPSKISELPEDPLPSPFDDPIETTPAPGVTSPHAPLDHSSDAAVPAPAPQAPGVQRPATVYEEGDAYGGI